MSFSRTSPPIPPPGLPPGTRADRRVIRSRPMEPLAPERRYVAPDAARAGLAVGIFSWVARRSRVKVDRGCFTPDGLRAPTQRHRQQARFNEYFELRGAGKISFADPSRDWLIHRNRIIFLGILIAVVAYCFYWIASA